MMEFEGVEEGYVSCPPTIHDCTTGASNNTVHCWNSLDLYFSTASLTCSLKQHKN